VIDVSATATSQDALVSSQGYLSRNTTILANMMHVSAGPADEKTFAWRFAMRGPYI
jgi:hypothetical protein